MKSKLVKRFLLRVLLGPAMMFGIMGADGEPPAVDPPPATDPPAEPAPSDPPPPAEDLSTIFSPEEITARKEAIAAAKVEEDRRAAMTQEERDAEDAKKAAEGEITYQEFKAPEGQTLDQAMLDAAVPIFKDLKLDQEQAQKLVDFQAQKVKEATEAFEADKTARLQAIKDGKEFGGDKFDATAESVGRALNTLLSQDEQVALKAYTERFGPSPELFTLMARVATRMKEDTSFEQGGQGGTRSTNFYNKSNMN